MQAPRGDVVLLLLVLDLGSRWVSGHRQALAVLYPQERTRGTNWVGAGWASELVWTQRIEKKSFFLCRGSNPDRPVCSQTLY
jgi:hypothetical protein